MRKAGIVLVTVLALTAAGALVAPAQAVKRPATPGRIDGLARATRAIVVYSWSSRSTRAVMRTYQRARPGDRWRLVRGRCRPGSAPTASRPTAARTTAPPRSGSSGSCTASAAAPTRACAGPPTAGCVSLRHKDLVAVLRWLRPGTRIAMGPAGYLNNRL